MAAADVLAFAPCETYCWPSTRPSTKPTGFGGDRKSNSNDALLNLRLSIISGTWMSLRSTSNPGSFTTRQHRAFVVPDFCAPKWSRGQRKPHSPSDDAVSSSSSLFDPTGTDSAAQQCRRSREDPDVPPLTGSGNSGTSRSSCVAGLLAEPGPGPIDFSTDEGLFQAAGKKKKKQQTTSFNWYDDNSGKQDGNGADGGGDGNKDQNGANSGSGGSAGGSGGGDNGGKKDDDNEDDGKKDDDKKGADAIDDDIWGSSAKVASKKQDKTKTSSAFGLPDAPATDFDEIKLNDSGGGEPGGGEPGDVLDLGVKAVKTGISAWTSSWGAGGWGWGLGGSQMDPDKPAEEEKPREAAKPDPWNADKKTTSNFKFGVPDDEGTKVSNNSGLPRRSKPAEKKDVGGFAWGVADTKTADADVWGDRSNKKYGTADGPKKLAGENSDDIWEWAAAKKEKADRAKPAIIEEMPASDLIQESPPAPSVTQKGQASEVKKAPEPALTPGEETELRKLQIKLDIGSKFTKIQAGRYKVLTAKVEAARLAAEAAAAASKSSEQLPNSGDAVVPPSVEAETPPDDLAQDTQATAAAQAEADEKARIVQEEEEEMAALRDKRDKRKLRRSERERLEILEEREAERAREAEEALAASNSKEQEDAARETTQSPDAAFEDTAVTEEPDLDAAQKAADEKARIIREEEEELDYLRYKLKLKRSERERLQELQGRAEERAREAEEAAAAAAAEAAVAAEAEAAQKAADEKARIIREEEDELDFLRHKIKLKRSERERLRELEDRAAERAHEAEEAAAAAAAEAAATAEAEAAAEAAAAAQAEADEEARIIREEGEELACLRIKMKLKRSERERLNELEGRVKERARKAKEAAEAAAEAAAAAEAEAAAQAAEAAAAAEAEAAEAEAKAAAEAEAAAEAAAQAEADEKARVIREEEEELLNLRGKFKLRRADRDRLQELEERANVRAREAEEAAAAEAAAKAAEEAAEAEAKAAAEAAAAAEAEAAAQAEAVEKARIIQKEEEEMSYLRSKFMLRKADRERLQELEEKAKARAREAEEAAAAEAAAKAAEEAAAAEAKAAAEAEAASKEDAPTSVVDADNDDQAERDAVARLIEEEEMELELLLSKPKLRRSEKIRLRELEESKRSREQEAAAKAEAEAEAKAKAEAEAEAVPESSGDAVDPQADESLPPADDVSTSDEAAQDDLEELDELAKEIIEEEEQELDLLLSKPKLRRAEKIRLQFLQENKEQREQEAASKAKAKAAAKRSGDVAESTTEDAEVPPPEEPPAEDPVDEDAARKEAEDALIAAEESELADLLSRYKLKKSEKVRVMELQQSKDKRAEEARLAAEKAEEEERIAREKVEEEERIAREQAEEEERVAREKAEEEEREFEEQRKRRKEEKLRAKIAAEEAEIASLKSKRKLRTAEKARLTELEARARDRAVAQAEKLAEEMRRNAAANEDQDKADPEHTNGFSWADEDPSKYDGAGNDWMNWGPGSSKKSKTKEEPSPPRVGPKPDKDDGEGSFWSPWGSSKKDKNGAPDSLIDFSGSDPLPAVPDAPPAVDADAFDFGWGRPSRKGSVVDDIWDLDDSSKKKRNKDSPVEVTEDPLELYSAGQEKDKADEDSFWSTFGSSKKDKTQTHHEAGNTWGPSVTSNLFSASKSKLSEKDSRTLSKADSKLSKKELEKLEKEKKKAEKEQREREKREAEEAAERARIEEEERLEAEAKAEEERQAREAEEQARKEEEEKQAALAAIAKEETDLAALQARKNAGRRLTRRETEIFDKLFASCQARADEKAAQEAAEQAQREEEERLAREAEEQAQRETIEKEEADLRELQRRKDAGRKLLQKEKDKYKLLLANKKARDAAAKEEAALKAKSAPEHDAAADNDLDKDLASLNANELDELDHLFSSPATPAPRAVEVNPFDFWGASRKLLGSKGKSPVSDGRPLQTTPQHPESTTSTKDVGNEPSPTCPSQSVPAEITHVEPSKPPETTSSGSAAVEDTTTKDVVDHAWPAGKEVHSSPSKTEPQPGSEPNHDLDIGNSNLPASSPSPIIMKARKPVGGKIADRLKAFEATASPPAPPPPPPAPAADSVPPPPPPRPAVPEDSAAEDKKKKSKNKAADIPGSFPGEEDDRVQDDNDIVGIIDMAPHRSKKDKKSSRPRTESGIHVPPPPPPNPDDHEIVGTFDMAPPKSKKDKKSSRSKTEHAIPVPPPPPPPPPVPDVPISPPPGPEPKKDSKRERTKLNRDAGSSWGMWTAATPSGRDKTSSSQFKYADEPRRETKSQSPEKEGKLSAPHSSSDKAERAERVKEKVKDAPPARPKVMNVFSSTPPISRSTSTREKRHREIKPTRRASIDVTSGMVSPPPEPEIPTMTSKAAKILGVGDGLGRTRSKRKNSSRPADEEVVMRGANNAAEMGAENPSRRRAKQYPRDENAVPVDTYPAPGLKRSNTDASATAKKGFGGFFSGMLSTPQPNPPTEPQRRKDYHGVDLDDGGAVTDADAAARKAARRARRAEREAAGGKTAEASRSSKDDARREKRRRQEEEAEAQRQAEREARRAERRAAKAREEEARIEAEEKEAAREERKRQKRVERERGAAAVNDDADDEEARRAARRERRKARAAESDREQEHRHVDEDEERRRRRAERRAAREGEAKSSSRQRAQPAEDDFVYSRPTKVSRRHTDQPEKPKRPGPSPTAWPHFGTSSWVKDHLGAGAPPDDGKTPRVVIDDIKDPGLAARREGMRRRKYGDAGVVDVEVGDGERRRRKRREERGVSEGSDERKKNSTSVDAAPKSGGGSWWKKLAGY